MSRIRVRMLGMLGSLFGINEEELIIQRESFVKDVLGELDKKKPGLKDLIVDPSLKNHSLNALILLNGVEIGNLNGLDTPVLDWDEITILSVTHGG